MTFQRSHVSVAGPRVVTELASPVTLSSCVSRFYLLSCISIL